MENKFLTLTNQRSGSSPFQRMLHSHRKIVARQEVMRRIPRDWTVENHLINTFRGDKPDTASGFKLQYDHIRPGIWEFVEKYELKVIQLIRRDLLETVLWFPQNHTGDTEGGLGPPLIVRGKVEAKIDKVLDRMVWLRDRIAENRHRAGFTVYYSEFTDNKNVASFDNLDLRKRLLEFLEVSDHGLTVDPKDNTKNTRGRSEDIVTNWKELIAEMNKRKIERYYKD